MVETGIHHMSFVMAGLDEVIWIIVVFFWIFGNIFASKNKKQQRQQQQRRRTPSHEQQGEGMSPVFSDEPVVVEEEPAIPLERDLREFLETVRRASEAAHAPEPVVEYEPEPEYDPYSEPVVEPPPTPEPVVVQKSEPRKAYKAFDIEEPAMQSYTLMRTKNLSVGLSGLSMKNVMFKENLHIHSNAGRKVKMIEDMRTPRGLRQAIYHSLILSPPKAYGDDWDGLKKFGGV